MNFKFTYPEAVGFLKQRQETRWELGTTRMRGLLASLGEPQRAFKNAIHVAGTNGKGSFCALLSCVLKEAGYRVGLYTSPHLSEVTERIRVNGSPVDREVFARLMAKVQSAEAEPATYFELVTACAFLHFREVQVDCAIVEVGLGGRLDATNVLENPLLTVITSIGLDHTDYLGETLAEITREKAGILKSGVPCLCGVQEPKVLAVIRGCAKRLGSELLERKKTLQNIASHWDQAWQELQGKGRTYKLGLLGPAAARNAALTLSAVEFLRNKGWDIPEEALQRGFSNVAWPARFQVLKISGNLPEGQTLILDGAHNPSAMESFASTWRASPWSRENSVFILGMLKDKDCNGMLRWLLPCAKRFIVTQPDSPRALGAQELARKLRTMGKSVSVAQTPEQAFFAFRDSGVPAGAACGSFYLVGRILELARAEPKNVPVGDVGNR